jgi:teichuronic acid biosynthesis glycosyltransferase TuaC
MRALIVTSMWPTAAAPQRGSFVRDQVEALRALGGADVEVFAFPPKGYARAARHLRRRYRGRRFDVVHAHFGLTAVPALAVRHATRVVTLHGTDLRHPRSRRITRAVLPRYDLVAAVSPELAAEIPGAGTRRRVAVLPCGVALDRFRPIPRPEARERLGLDPAGRYLLFPSDPSRPEKRHDRARALAEAAGATLLTYDSTPPRDVPLLINAANAVVVTSEREGFGLAALEALACDVPVLATNVGIAPLALKGVKGTLVAPFALDRWLAAVKPHLDAPDSRVDGRARAALFDSNRMAMRVFEAYRALLQGSQ